MLRVPVQRILYPFTRTKMFYTDKDVRVKKLVMAFVYNPKVSDLVPVVVRELMNAPQV